MRCPGPKTRRDIRKEWASEGARGIAAGPEVSLEGFQVRGFGVAGCEGVDVG